MDEVNWQSCITLGDIPDVGKKRKKLNDTTSIEEPQSKKYKQTTLLEYLKGGEKNDKKENNPEKTDTDDEDKTQVMDLPNFSSDPGNFRLPLNLFNFINFSKNWKTIFYPSR